MNIYIYTHVTYNIWLTQIIIHIGYFNHIFCFRTTLKPLQRHLRRPPCRLTKKDPPWVSARSVRGTRPPTTVWTSSWSQRSRTGRPTRNRRAIDAKQKPQTGAVQLYNSYGYILYILIYTIYIYIYIRIYTHICICKCTYIKYIYIYIYR